MKKLMLAIAPALVLAAMFTMPAMAQAETKEYGTLNANNVFVPFAENVETAVKTEGTTAFKLEASGETIECQKLKDKGHDTNVGGVGTSEETLTFEECKVNTGILAGCQVSSKKGKTTIVGPVTNLVLSEKEVEIKVTPPGFPIITTGAPAGCPELLLGTVTTKTTGTIHTIGTQAPGSNLLVFSHVGGLEFIGEEAFITGSDESFKGTKPVIIN